MCWTPTFIRNPDKLDKDRYIPVPCGRCAPCKKRRAQQWTFRLLQEKRRSASSFFITLTYDDGNLVYGDMLPTTCLRDWQNYWKRLRKANPCRFNYYGCSEYGSKSGRPHYHAIVFASAIVDSNSFALSWPHGHVDVGRVTTESVSYVTGYILKDSPVKEAEDAGMIERSRSYMSKGLGSDYLSDSVVNFHKAGDKTFCVLSGGQKIALPRYYRDKIWPEGDEDEKADRRRLKLQLKRASKERAKKLIDEFARKYPELDYDRERFKQVKHLIDRELYRLKSKRSKL